METDKDNYPTSRIKDMDDDGCWADFETGDVLPVGKRACLKNGACPGCNGRGYDVVVECPDCGGSGYDPEVEGSDEQCTDCAGSGEVTEDVCPVCGGEGTIDEDENDVPDLDDDD